MVYIFNIFVHANISYFLYIMIKYLTNSMMMNDATFAHRCNHTFGELSFIYQNTRKHLKWCAPYTPHKVSLDESAMSVFSEADNAFLAPGFSWIFVSFCEMDSMMFTNPIPKTSYVSAQCFYIIWVVTSHGLFALSWSWNRLALNAEYTIKPLIQVAPYQAITLSITQM